MASILSTQRLVSRSLSSQFGVASFASGQRNPKCISTAPWIRSVHDASDPSAENKQAYQRKMQGCWFGFGKLEKPLTRADFLQALEEQCPTRRVMKLGMQSKQVEAVEDGQPKTMHAVQGVVEFHGEYGAHQRFQTLLRGTRREKDRKPGITVPKFSVNGHYAVASKLVKVNMSLKGRAPLTAPPKNASRVLLIRGPADANADAAAVEEILAEEALRKFFVDQGIDPEAQLVETRSEEDGRRVIEWRFMQWREQAELAMPALKTHYPDLRVEYGLDPCAYNEQID